MPLHHYVPKFILKRFVGKHGKLCTYEIESGKREYKPARAVACSDNFYDFIIEGKEISYEGRLSKLESNCARIINDLIEKENTSFLSFEKKSLVSTLLSVQSFRTSSFFAGAAALSVEARGKIFTSVLRSAGLTQRELLSRKWVLMKIEDEHTFYIGDHPITFQNTENPSKSGQLGFDIVGVEAFFPLTPKLALYIPHQSTSDELTRGYANARSLMAEAAEAAMRGVPHPMANPEGLALLRSVIINGARLDDAFNLGIPITASNENVINFNYLQIMFSHRFVFSSSDNFSFADQVLIENPQYKKVPNVTFSHFGYPD